MMAEEYHNFKEGLSSKPNLVSSSDIQNKTLNSEKDYYISIFKYNDLHKKIVDNTGSVSGIKDVTTNSLVWDFDSTDLNKAKEDVIKLCTRLVNSYKVDPDQILAYLSGNKGFHIYLNINRNITPDQFKKATSYFAKDLETFDPSVSDAPRIIRVPNTKHPKTGLYKIPLHISEIDEMNIEDIKKLANKTREVEFNYAPVNLPDDIFKIPEKKKLELVTQEDNFDYSTPPKGWKQYKWALAQGWFEEGERHNALMVIAATCRGLGYSKDHAYYICKAALKKMALRTGSDEFPKEELYTSIIESVFSDKWEGGQYSVKNNPWLQKYCEKMKFDTKDAENAPVIELDTLIGQFITYSTNFDQNIIKTGIKELDENLILSTSTLNGLLGQPGSGKTTMAIEILKNASLNGVPSMFFSLDMGPPLVFSKLVQKESGLGFKSSLEIFKNDVERRQEIGNVIKTKYKNVGFNFKCGLTTQDLKNCIIEQSERTGIKPKLIVVDYLENLSGPYADPTANASMITNQLKDIATEMEVCILLLLQTQKHSTPEISDPLLSMKQIKGSSSIEQNCSVVLTLWREGYNPSYIEDDKYISFAIVKNRFGSLWRGDFTWEPIKGNINSLTEEQKEEFEQFKKRKWDEKARQAKEKEDWV